MYESPIQQPNFTGKTEKNLVLIAVKDFFYHVNII